MADRADYLRAEVEITEAQHRLRRSLRRLAIDIVREDQNFFEAREFEKLEEREEQHQVEIAGTADTGWAQTQFDLAFDHAFVTAAARRNSLLTRPHFTFGFEMVSASANGQPTDAAAILSATVTKWTRKGVNIVGATVVVSACATGPMEFKALAHLSFQGYGQLIDDPDLEG